jgi:uncharacterized protein (TIGR03435 family)
MKLFIVLFFTAFLLSAKAVSLPDGPQVGQTAPALNLPVWLQSPPEAALGWPTGKVVVLEFWSTSCGPCVADIPHLNELADEFTNKPVQFIAVTADPVQVIQRFLKKTPINAWLGLGPEAGFGEETPYKVMVIPHTVLIGPHGRIAAITDPWMLTSDMIQSCLNGRISASGGRQASATNNKHTRVEYHWESGGGQLPGWVPGQYEAGIKPLYQVMIRPTPTNTVPASRGNNLSSSDDNRPVECWMPGRALTAQNDTLENAIKIVFDVKPTRLIVETKLPKEKYDFYITLPPAGRHPQKPFVFESVFSQAVAATFGLDVRRQMRDVDVLVLRTNAASLEILSRSTDPDGAYSAFWNEAAATNMPLKTLAEELEISSSKPVLDETGLTNQYNFEIKWKQKDYSRPNIPGMIDAVKKMGLTLDEMKRPMKVVVVSRQF